MENESRVKVRTRYISSNISQEGTEEVECIEDLEGEALEVPEEGFMGDVVGNI